MNTMYKQVMCDVASVSVTKDAKSPYWVAQWTDARGKRVKRSTKVPVAGGVYRGERLTPAQARKRHHRASRCGRITRGRWVR